MTSKPATPQPAQREHRMTAALLAGLVVTALAFALLAWLGRGIVLGVTWPLDTAMRNTIHTMASPRLTRLMIAVSLYGGPTSLVTVGLVIAAVFLWRGWHRGVLLTVVTMAGAGLLDTLLKLAFGRTRPAPFFDYPLPQSLSFPSGHAFFSASFLGCCFLTTFASCSQLSQRPSLFLRQFPRGLRGADLRTDTKPAVTHPALVGGPRADPSDRLLPSLPWRALPQ